MVVAARIVGPTNIAQFDLLRWLSPAVQDEFRRATHVRKLSKGEIIYADGDVKGGMYRVLSGSVRLVSAEAGGHELLYLLFGPGDCFGISSCIDGEPRAHTTEAGSNAELAVLPREAFDRLRRQHREFDHALLQVLSRYMRKLSSSLSQSELDDLPTPSGGALARRDALFRNSV